MGVTYSGPHAGITLTTGFAQKNPVTIAADGTITAGAGYNGDAIYGAHQRWTITNLGTIEGGANGYGIALTASGSIVNGPGGLIEGGAGGISVTGAKTAPASTISQLC